MPPVNWTDNVVNEYRQLEKNIEEPIELILVQDGADNRINEHDINFLIENIPSFRFIQYNINKGKGYAIRQGVSHAIGDIIIYTDIDFPYTLQSIIAIYAALKSNQYDIAVGVKNKDYYSHVPRSRRIVSKYLKWLIGVFLSMPITDTQCGLKGFRNKVKPLFLITSINRYLFDLEFIRNSFKEKYRVIAIPIELKNKIHFRQLNYRILFPEIINFIKLLFK